MSGVYFVLSLALFSAGFFWFGKRIARLTKDKDFWRREVGRLRQQLVEKEKEISQVEEKMRDLANHYATLDFKKWRPRRGKA